MNLDVSKLAAALACAARGLRVFPLYANSKLPARDDWTERATVDPTQIRSWWVDPVTNAERDLNIGCLTSDWIVPDIDVKEGRDGFSDALELNLDFDTFTVRTPSDGFHLYYQPLPDRRTGQSPLSQGIDVRSFNGYVVGPGSTIDGKAYTIEVDGPIAPFPAHLADRLKAPKQKDERVLEDVPWDSPTGIQLAINYVKEMPGIPEGYRGRTCYEAACKLREWAITPERQVELFLEHWNERNGPRMERSEVEFAVRNAFRYATGLAGGKLPSLEFGDLKLTPPPPLEDYEVTEPRILIESGAFDYGRALAVQDTTAREWIVRSLLVPRTITSLVASGGAGKSILSLTLAAHIAVGKPFLGREILRPGKSLLYNAEDDIAELSRRLQAICAHYQFDYEFVNSRIGIMTSEDGYLLVAGGHPLQLVEPHVALVVERASDPEVVAVFLDPMTEVHEGNENDSGDMRFVLKAIRDIARKADVSVVLVHHTAKHSKASADSYAGDQNAGRGSTAIPNASRVMLTMFPVTEAEERRKIGVMPNDLTRYVKINGAKGNFSENTGETLYMRWHKRLVAGEEIGVLIEHHVADAVDRSAGLLAYLIGAWMEQAGETVVSVGTAADAARAADKMFADQDKKAVEASIRKLLIQWISPGAGFSVRYFANTVEMKLDGEPSKELVPLTENPP